ncbi:MAG: ParB/RepB/Spo0J family partition protein [Saprospiraceae bacterium]|nr:ParB/RepB/Spo0J family partition protein [Saprospiraceae bacterium]
MSKKKGNFELGKGIRALLNNIDEEIKDNPEEVVRELSSSVAMIPVAAVEVNPFQPRKDFDDDALAELSDSIKTYGLIQPITVRRLNDKQYQLISGERRTRAARLAGLTEIPAYIRIADDQGMLEMALVENIQREDLNAIEIAITYQRLVDECNITHESMSDRVGKKRSTITNYLRLLKLNPEIQQAIKLNKISMGHARALVGVNDIALQLMLFRQITKEELSVRAVEDLIRKYNEQKGNKSKLKNNNSLPDIYRNIQDELSHKLGTKVQLKLKGSGIGEILIKFGSDNELNRLLDVLDGDN